MRYREDDALGAGGEQIVADHDRVEVVVGERVAEHGVGAIVDEHLRNAQKAKLPLLLSTPRLGQEPLHDWPVRFGRDAMELEDIYVVHTEPLQAALQRLGQRTGRTQRQFSCLMDGGMELGSQHVTVAGYIPQRAAQNGLALAVGGRGIQQIDAEVQRPSHHANGSGRGHAALLP